MFFFGFRFRRPGFMVQPILGSAMGEKNVAATKLGSSPALTSSLEVLCWNGLTDHRRLLLRWKEGAEGPENAPKAGPKREMLIVENGTYECPFIWSWYLLLVCICIYMYNITHYMSYIYMIYDICYMLYVIIIYIYICIDIVIIHSDIHINHKYVYDMFVYTHGYIYTYIQKATHHLKIGYFSTSWNPTDLLTFMAGKCFHMAGRFLMGNQDTEGIC